MTRIKSLLAAGLACTCVGFAAPVCGQGMGFGGNGNGIGRGAPGMGTAGHMATFRGAETATRALLSGLRTRLAITPSQEAAWQAFENAAIAEAADMDIQNMHRVAPFTNAADALNYRASVMRRQADDATAVAVAFARLYDQLTAAQREILDDYFG
jgi:hypothetical protein